MTKRNFKKLDANIPPNLSDKPICGESKATKTETLSNVQNMHSADDITESIEIAQGINEVLLVEYKNIKTEKPIQSPMTITLGASNAINGLLYSIKSCDAAVSSLTASLSQSEARVKELDLAANEALCLLFTHAASGSNILQRHGELRDIIANQALKGGES